MEKSLEYLERRIEALEREKAEALHALEMAASLGSFETGLGRLPNPDPILAQIASRASTLLGLEAVAIYLTDEDSADFRPAYMQPLAAAAILEAETNRLIVDHCFSSALEEPAAHFFRASDGRRLVLHVVATPARVRGMFVGLMPEASRNSDVALALFDVILLAGAHALESFELNRQFKAITEGLEERIGRRTAELTEANKYLGSILDSIQAGVMLVDAHTHEIVDVNPAAAGMIGLPRLAIVGRKCFRFVCTACVGGCPLPTQGRSFDDSERVLLTASGEEIPILKTVVRVTVRDRACYLESFVDISERKKLDLLREGVERIMRHDLKTPLNAIIGFPQLLLDTPGLDDEQREMIGVIRDAGRRMLRMIDLSLDLFKMETGRYQFYPRLVDMTAVIRTVAAELGPLAARKDVRLDLGPAQGPVRVMGEETLCAAMMGNLLKNAIEASPEGAAVTVTLSMDEELAMVSIQNLGTVPEEVRSRFFEKYSSGKAGGTGLGTYSARLMAVTMGGGIDFTTSEGDGTTVLVWLPTKRSEELADAG